MAFPGVSDTLDGIIKLSGTDFITFDAIDMLDPSSNAGVRMMESGYSLLRASANDGCKNVVIKIARSHFKRQTNYQLAFMLPIVTKLEI